jgi:3-oxoadipate enol-lactonase
VLVHAGLWDARMWDDQFAVFAHEHTILRYDLRGFGRSSLPDRSFSNIQDLADLMAGLGMESAAVVGCSAGAALSLDFALEHPEMVDALVLVASGLSGDDTPDPEEMQRIYQDVEVAVEAGDLERATDLELTVWAPLGTSDPVGRRIREIAQDNRHANEHDWTLARRLDPPAAGRLGEIRVPTLVVLADQDAPIMQTIGSKLAEGIPGARKDVIVGADHLPNMRKPDEFNRLVLEFLNRTDTGPTPPVA